MKEEFLTLLLKDLFNREIALSYQFRLFLGREERLLLHVEDFNFDRIRVDFFRVVAEIKSFGPCRVVRFRNCGCDTIQPNHIYLSEAFTQLRALGIEVMATNYFNRDVS